MINDKGNVGDTLTNYDFPCIDYKKCCEAKRGRQGEEVPGTTLGFRD